MMRRSRGGGPRLEGRDRDRVWSEYMEMLASQHPASARLPGTRAVAITVLGSVAVAYLLFTVLQFAAISSTWKAAIVALGSLAVLTIAILLTTGAVGPRRSLWFAAMRRCGHDVCVRCGYWLAHRAPASRACPECGTPDDEQPIALGERTGSSDWPHFEPDPPEPGPRDDDRR